MTLYVNTIEHNGVKAVINSYTPSFPELDMSMTVQLQEWLEHYPNADIRTEKLSMNATMDLVALGNSPYAIGQSSVQGERQ